MLARVAATPERFTVSGARESLVMRSISACSSRFPTGLFHNATGALDFRRTSSTLAARSGFGSGFDSGQIRRSHG